MTKHTHYFKDVSHLKQIDVYRVLDLWEVTSPAVQHAIKKLLNAGGRGAKGYTQDLQEAIDSIQRALEMEGEDGGQADSYRNYALGLAGISWDDAPAWAQWLAQDEDGSWWWYEQRPELARGFWNPPGAGKHEYIWAEMPFTDDWENSLCSRDYGVEKQ